MRAVGKDAGVARHERMQARDFDHPLREALDGRAFWRSTVLTDPDAGFVILGGRATFQSVNGVAAEILLGADPSSLYGLTLFDVLPLEIAAERTAYYHHVLRTERPLLVNSVWRGVRCRERWELLPGDARLAGQVMWQLRRTPAPWPGRFVLGLDVLDATQNDWGALAALSVRERGILELMAAGCRTSEIAVRLGISGMEAMRCKRSIRAKLGAGSTAEVLRIAFMAGLVPVEQLAAPDGA